MLLTELFENLQLLLLVAGWQPHFLLPLIVHHLLDHAPRLTVQIAQLRVFRLDLGGVDGGVVGEDVWPPFHLILLLEVDFDALLVFEGPG